MKQQSMKALTGLVLIGTVVLHAGGSLALAQQRAPREPSRAQAAPSAEQARQRINRQLKTLERQEQRLRTALRMLDEGQSPQQIREFLSNDAERRAGDRERPDGQDSERPRRRRAPEQPISPDEALSALSELNPELHRHLQSLKERDVRRYQSEINRLIPRLGPIARQRRAHPDHWEARVQMFHAEQRARRLARRATMATDDDERQARVDELRELINRQFVHRERMHEIEIGRGERNVGEQRRRLKEARANRPQLVAQRVEEMLKRAAQDELLDDHQPRRRRENPGL